MPKKNGKEVYEEVKKIISDINAFLQADILQTLFIKKALLKRG